MVGILGPAVFPLQKGIDLAGKTTVVTGATSGIGLALYIQLVERNIAALVLAVRDVSKGQSLKSTLLSNRIVASATTKPSIHVLRLDMEDYASVDQFCDEFLAKFDRLDILFANAGIGTLKKEVSKAGHEQNIQVNYYSNVLLLLRIIPVMEATSAKTGQPSRLTITGSQTHANSTLRKNTPPTEVPILKHLDELAIGPGPRYANSKMAVLLFMRELSPKLDSKKVILNAFCPGTVETGMINVLPLPLKVLYKVLYMNWVSKTPEEGAWIGMRSGIVLGEETHGKLVAEDVIQDYSQSDWLNSIKGLESQRKVWTETLAEMEKMKKVPSWLRI